MILYIENSKDSTWKLLELINEFSKIAGFKINTQKLVVFLYSDMSYQRAKKEKKSIKIPLKKYLGINLTKDVKDSYTENCKTLINKIGIKKMEK